MVQKLQNGDYLKRYSDMTVEERAAYGERVGEWMRSGWKILEFKSHAFNARMQNVQQVSATWNDAECQAFEEGAKLLSALIGRADTWLPDMLYVKSAKRAMDIMYTAIGTVMAPENENADQEPKEEVAEGTGMATQPVGDEPAEDGPKKANVRMQAGEAKENIYTIKAGEAFSVNGAAAAEGPTDVTQAKPEDVQVSVELPVPSRPKHVDQYVHLLPVKTQENAARLKDLYRELDSTREKMNLLMDDPTAKDDDRAAWAKKATAIDNRIRKVLDELDAEWAKLVRSGRVVVDDLGNARVINNVNNESVAGAEEPAGLTSEQKARRRELRKWLVDTRRGNGETREEHVGKWKENFREFLALEGDTAFDDEKVKAAAGHYGIDMNELKR